MPESRFQFATGEQQIFSEEELKNPAVQERLSGATLLSGSGIQPQVRRHTTPEETLMAGLDITPPTPAEEEKKREMTRQQMQASIDAINAQFAGTIMRAREAGLAREQRTRATVSTAGLLGSPRGEAFREEAERLTTEDLDRIEREKSARIQEINVRLTKQSEDEIKAEQARVSGNIENFFTILNKVRTDTREDIKTLAQGNQSFAELSPSMKENFLRRGGFTDETGLKAFFTAQNPQANVQVIGNSIVSVRRDPKEPSGFKVETIQTFDDKTAKNVKDTIKTDTGITIIKNDGTWETIGLPEEEVTAIKAKREAELAKTGAETEQARAAAAKARAEEAKIRAETVGAEGSTKIQNQLDLAQDSLTKAKGLSHASGRSGVRKKLEGWLVGSTDYTNLVAETNTVRTNVLTLVADPNIKKFFGPQMTEKDVELMTSAGTTLNPELQSPEKLDEELERLQKLFDKLKSAIQQKGIETEDRVDVVGPDGKLYDLPASQLQEALSQGYALP